MDIENKTFPYEHDYEVHFFKEESGHECLCFDYAVEALEEIAIRLVDGWSVSYIGFVRYTGFDIEKGEIL